MHLRNAEALSCTFCKTGKIVVEDNALLLGLNPAVRIKLLRVRED